MIFKYGNMNTTKGREEQKMFYSTDCNYVIKVIEKDCVIVGVGDRLEIWSEEKWNNFYEGNKDSYVTKEGESIYLVELIED